MLEGIEGLVLSDRDLFFSLQDMRLQLPRALGSEVDGSITDTCYQ